MNDARRPQTYRVREAGRVVCRGPLAYAAAQARALAESGRPARVIDAAGVAVTVRATSSGVTAAWEPELRLFALPQEPGEPSWLGRLTGLLTDTEQERNEP